MNSKQRRRIARMRTAYRTHVGSIIPPYAAFVKNIKGLQKEINLHKKDGET